ncbi:MAG: type II secretion system F family protein, partial [Burkholderiaceae bacterium]
MDPGFILFAVVAFVAVVLLIEGSYLLWRDYRGPETRRLENRLRSLSAGRHGVEASLLIKQRHLSETPWLDRLLLSVPRISSLDRLLEQAGTALTVSRFLAVSLLAGGLAFLMMRVARAPLPFAMLFAVLTALIPGLVMVLRRGARLRKFDEQLPGALDLLSRALRAGHALPSALQLVATEAAEPLRAEFQVTFDEINYGVSISDAMMNLATRVPSLDLRYFVISVLLQRDTG